MVAEKLERVGGRIVMIDVLRGIALAGILLLHHVEHFDFYRRPDHRPDWLVPIDQWVWDNAFGFISGKAFALFCLLFGLSYWIIYERTGARGERYFFRHFWRMALLAGFGALHVVFFRGDILIMYAVLGLPLVFTRWMHRWVVLGLGLVLIINPLNVYVIATYLNGDGLYDFRLSYPQTGMGQFLLGDSFWELAKANFLYGFEATLVWSWNVGRMFTIPGLFLLGVYMGMTRCLTEGRLRFWCVVFGLGVLCWLATDLVGHAWVEQIEVRRERRVIGSIVDIYEKLSVLAIGLSAFVVTWRHNAGRVRLGWLASYGRMGLTNYILMSVIGASLYYGWGLGWYRYCGSTVSLLIGVGALLLQMGISVLWLRTFKQGPLETIWRIATWGRGR